MNLEFDTEDQVLFDTEDQVLFDTEDQVFSISTKNSHPPPPAWW